MNGDDKERRLVLEVVGESRPPVELPRAGVLTIGSKKGRADVVVDGQGVADVHCAIGRVKGGGWALKDLGSEFGTFVNGERVQTKKLEIGDQLLVGSRRLRVADPERPVERAPAPALAAASSASGTPASTNGPRAAAVSETALRARGEALPLPQVKGYRVEKLLGRGGMGEVYLAVQESLGRPVALKVLSPRLEADADFVRRFQAEARAAAALNHPNVVTVHDVWEDGGRHMLAMEYMDRGNLETRVAREGRVPVREAIEILSDAAKALVFAELRGIVHRDIKPANLMQNSVGTTKVADLGLATHLEAEATEADNKKIFGTPHFISPEQARGERVDCRSDLYSLGATVYRVLSGRTPFEGATTRDILRGHFTEAPKPLADLAPDAPAGLVRIVHRLLEKKPDDRFPSAGVLLQEVERLKSESLHGITPPPLVVERRSRTGLWIGVAAAGVVAAAAIFFASRGEDEPNAGGPRNGSVADDGRDPEADGTPDDGTLPPPDDTTPITTGPRDDDTALKARELEAENDYLRLASGMSPAERAAALEELAQRHAGTAKAESFASEAHDLRLAVERERIALDEKGRAVELALATLQGAAPDESAPIGSALRAMLAVSVAPDVAADPTFAEKRRQAFLERVRRAAARARQAFDDVGRLEESGDFDGVARDLERLRDSLDAPDALAELGPELASEVAELNRMRGVATTRLQSLPALRERHTQRQASADARRVADALRGDGSFQAALRTLDFAALDTRLAALEAGVTTEPARAFARDWRTQLAAGKGAIDTLAAEFEQGHWRRKTVPDPRARSRASREVLGVNARGLNLAASGSVELVEWSAFGGRAEALHQLFFERLAREFTREELAGIEALVRGAAVLEVVTEADEVLQPSSGNVLSEEEARSMLAVLDVARGWATALGDTSAIDAEREAVTLLIDGLRAASAGSWSRAVALVERLLAEHRSTLTVRLLSDAATEE